MKILGICGSPRKGNCFSALNSIKEKYADQHDFKLLMLSDLNLQMCKGCYSCIFNGEETCPLKDDRDMLIKELFAADAVVFASPVYVNHISSYMKKMIERIGYMGHRPRFQDKYALVMSVCKAFGAKKANKYMKEVFNTFGFNVVSTLELKASKDTLTEQKLNNEKVTKAFEKVITSYKKGEKSPPTMANLIMFYMYKYVSDVYKDKFKADYEYYKDLKEYPYEGRINFLKKIMAKRVVKKFKREVAAINN